LVIEVFGRYAGYTALLPTMAGAANRCVIPEHEFDMEHLTELLIYDRDRNPSSYSVVLVSEGAKISGDSDMSFEGDEADMFGHKKLGGVGDRVANGLKALSPKFNQGRKVNVISQRLGYLVRCGDPDALDSIVPMVFGNLALDLIDAGTSGKLVSIHNGRYGSVPMEAIMGTKKVVDVEKYYDTERLRPKYKAFNDLPLFIMTSDI
jgi:6-phosphofructokinase 1